MFVLEFHLHITQKKSLCFELADFELDAWTFQNKYTNDVATNASSVAWKYNRHLILQPR